MVTLAFSLAFWQLWLLRLPMLLILPILLILPMLAVSAGAIGAIGADLFARFSPAEEPQHMI